MPRETGRFRIGPIVSISLLLLLWLSACGGGGSSEEDETDGDADLEMPLPDCAAWRSAPNPEFSNNCVGWCNAVEACGGATSDHAYCIKSCYAKTYEYDSEAFGSIQNCILKTTCLIYEQALEDGDSSSNLEEYCRNRVSTPPDRRDFCDELYDKLIGCGNYSAETYRNQCLTLFAPVASNDHFKRYVWCAKDACESNWQHCVDDMSCWMGGD